MKKSANMSFRLPEALKSELSKTSSNAGMSLTDFNIFLIKSYLKDGDGVQQMEMEKDKWQVQAHSTSVALEQSKKDLSNVKNKYQEQQLEIANYRKIVQESVNKAYRKGFDDGLKQKS